MEKNIQFDIINSGGQDINVVLNVQGDLKKYIKKNKVNVAISGHGNSIRLFRRLMEGASKKEAISWFIPYDKVYTYRI